MSVKEKAVKVGDKVLIPVITGAGGALVANQAPQNQRSSKKALKDIRKNLVPIIKSDDPEFNHEAAHKAAAIVMALDDDEAYLFCKMVVGDLLDADITKNRRTLQSHLDRVVAKRINRIKKAMLTTVVKSDTEHAVEYAEALAEIEKAYKNPYETGRYQFDESDFRRDRGGRFTTKVRVNPEFRALNDKQAKNLGIPDAGMKLAGQTRKQYQQEYMQVANFLNTMTENGHLGGDHKVWARVQSKHGVGNPMHWVELENGKLKPGIHYDPKTERIVSVEANPTDLTVGGAAFGLLPALGRESVRSLNQADKHYSSFSRDWMAGPENPKNSTDRLYQRVKAGSDFVYNVAPNNSKIQMAAKLGSIVGDHGKEAEAVFGPSTRKTAYRYRGTEKKPDAEVIRQYDLIRERALRPEPLSPEETRRLRARQSRALTNERKRVATETNTPENSVRLTGDQTKAVNERVEAAFMRQRPAPKVDPMAERAALSVLRDHLIEENRAPNKDLFGLQLASGNTPPSEGFLIDKNGKVVAQAIGYGDDHYIPFNLRNLKNLNGGEYIRSRSVGGPTTEDIYTGLMAGAKRVTVVSRSGTFVIDFEDDFKGRRRYNDKAHRMVRRYEGLLDAVQSEQVDRPQRISPEVRAMFAREVEATRPYETRQAKRAAVKAMEEEYKQEISSLDEEDFNVYMDDTTEELLRTVGGMPEAQQRRIRAQMRNDWQAHNEYKFKLNGWGYRDALKSLQEQFPYYIKTDYVPTGEKERFEPEKDKGYVEPGRNRPTEALEGRYGTAVRLGGRIGNDSVTGGKFSASQADYQGYRGTFRRVAPEPSVAPEPTPAKAPEEAKPAVSVQAKEEERKTQLRVADASVNLIKAIRDNVDLPADEARRKAITDSLPPLAMTSDEEIAAYFQNRENVRKAEEGIKSLRFRDEQGQPLATLPQPVQDALRDYETALGQRGRVDYDPKAALTYSGQPFLFPEPPYQSGASRDQVKGEWARLNHTRPVSDAGLTLSEMTEEDYRNEINVLMRVGAALRDESFKAIPVTDLEARKSKIIELGIDPEVPGVAAILEGENLNRHAKIVQRARALRLVEAQLPAETGPIGELEEPPTAYLPERTIEDVQANKQYLANTIQLFQRAATALAETEDDRRILVSNALLHRAEAFKDMAKLAEVDADKVKMITENSAAELVIAYRYDQGNPLTEEEVEQYIAANDL